MQGLSGLGKQKDAAMLKAPESVVGFLEGKRIAVAGVSRQAGQAANAIYRKLRDQGYQVFPINPGATQVEGVRCYPNLSAVGQAVDGVVIATHPDVSIEIVRQCAELGIRRVWFHRSFGQGSVSEAAISECGRLGIEPIIGGCPLMYCEPVDIGHKCMRWWLARGGRVPT